MTSLSDAKKFWSAAFLIRRGQGRDRSVAIKVLEQLYTEAIGPIQDRANKLLVDIHNVTDANTTRADGQADQPPRPSGPGAA